MRDRPRHLIGQLVAGAAVMAVAAVSFVIVAAPAGAATFTVTNLDDSGAGSLRAAIDAVNGTVGAGHIIDFDPELTGTIQLESALPTMSNLDVTIAGPGADAVTVAGDGTFRILTLDGMGTYTVSGLTITGGFAADFGGGIVTHDTALHLEGVRMIENSAGDGGGALVVLGAPLVISDSEFVTNTTMGDGGAIWGRSAEIHDTSFEGNFAAGSGGAAYFSQLPDPESVSRSSIEDSTFDDNSSQNRGGAVVVSGNPVSIVRTEFTSNRAVDQTATHGGDGGALYLHETPDVPLRTDVIEESTFVGNSAERHGGAIAASDAPLSVAASYFDDNQAGFDEDHAAADGHGGGVALLLNAPATFEGTTFFNDAAASAGGAIYSGPASDLRIDRSTLEQNSAGTGGGAVSVDGDAGQITTINASTINHNVVEQGRGGGVHAHASDLVVTSSTISSNQAFGTTDGHGGAISLQAPGDVHVAHSTIVANMAQDAGGGISGEDLTPGVLDIDHTILADNLATAGTDLWSSTNADVVMRYSLLGTDDGAAFVTDPEGASNLTDVDPQLGPLADNGGPTLTHHPQAGSPVIDAGDPTFESAEVLLDQRGLPRVRAVIDIGSVEVQPDLGGGGGGGGTPPPDDDEPATVCPDDLSNPFVDVPSDNVHLAAISCLLALGLTEGTSATTFDPAGTVTRGQAASFLARLIELTDLGVPADPPDAFEDDDGTTHEPALDQLAAAGVMLGTAPRTVDPGAPLSRGQLASLVVRAHEYVTGETAVPAADHFDDDDGTTHEDNINVAADLGLVLGTGPGTFAPSNPIRRDQMASILVRLVGALSEAGHLSP